MPIRRLPPLLVNQIAAGEVIERPASVVKELIENAIDAGARRVRVELEQGGRELIRVADDGGGIPEAELPLALAPHATSKIETAADLERIGTLGFRGEALASIASVSRITILSRPPGASAAAQVEGEGADLRPPRPAGGPPGTTVTVRNLFFNTPARRRFLRAEKTEGTRGLETVENLALAHPDLAFSLTVDGRERLELPPHRQRRGRVLAVLGGELSGELLEVAEEAPGVVGLHGFVGTPAVARSTGRHLRLFVNGRFITDRTIVHALREAYRGLVDPGRFPLAVLFLELDPAAVDVNVHPSKAEVRFRNQHALHEVVRRSVQETLRGADLTPQLDVRRGAHAPPAAPGGSGWHFTAPAPADDRTGALVASLRGLDTRQKGLVYGELKAALAREAPEVLEREIAERGAGAIAPLTEVAAGRRAMQVHASYIVTEDEDGLLIIDQHALHERVMFEKLRQRVERGTLESQRLLMPVVVEIDAAQMDALAALAPLLERLGIDAEPMGPAAAAVHGFPSLLFERGVTPGEFLAELLGRAVGEGLAQNPEAALHEVLDMMACKAAVKAGDRLEPEEIDALLKDRGSVERSSSCPHGRPTTLRLSLAELERQFGRR